MNPVSAIDDRRALPLRQKNLFGVFHGNRLAIHSNLERTERAWLQSGFQAGEFHRGKSKLGGSEGKPQPVRRIEKTRKNGGCGTRRKSLGFVQKLVPDLRRISNKMPLTLTLSRPTGEGTARPVSRSFHSGWIRPPTEHDSPSPIRYVFSVFDECLPLPARDERGEGRGGGESEPHLSMQPPLPGPLLPQGRRGRRKHSARLNT